MSQSVSLKDYFARVGSRYSDKDARLIGPVFERIGPKSNQEIVDIAADTSTPEGAVLHKYFEWDDKKCGVYYRRLQAGDMVRSVMVRVRTPEGVVTEIAPFQKVSVITIDASDTRKDGNGHSLKVIVPIDEVAKNDRQKQEILERARAELVSFRKRYSAYRDVLAGEGWNSLFVSLSKILEDDASLSLEEAAD